MVHWIGFVFGICASLFWLAYVAYIVVAKHLGIPAHDEQVDIALVAIALIAAGWVLPLLTFHLHGHVGSRLQKARGDRNLE